MSIAGAREQARRPEAVPEVPACATMAPPLQRFARRYGMDETALATWLELTLGQLDALAAAPRPAAEARDYEEQLRRLAEQVGCDPFLVRTVLKYGT